MQGHTHDSVIRYIRVAREAMNRYQKQKFDGSGYQGSHGGHWDRSGVKVKETHRDSTTVTARDSVADEVVTQGEETGTSAEAAVREGVMVQTPTPSTKTSRKFRAAVITVRKEVGHRRKNNGLGWGMGENICEAMPSRRSH